MERAEQVEIECLKCADVYEKTPGLDSHLTTIDLYRAIARLARIVEVQQKTIDELRGTHTPDKETQNA